MKKTITHIGFIALLSMTAPLALAMAPHHMHADITPAPGKGIFPAIYPHYTQEPSFYDFDHMPLQQITKNISRRFVMGANATLQEWHVKAGATLPLHYHLNEAVISIKKGSFAAFSQGKKYILTPGKILVIPPFVPHEFVALKEDSILVGFVTPVRQDYLGGLAAVPDASAANKLLHAR